MSRPGAMQIGHPVPWGQSIVSRACHRISHDLIHMFHLELLSRYIYILQMNATHRKVIGLADVGNLGGEHGFAIEAAGQGSRFSRSAKDRAVDDKAARRWPARVPSPGRLGGGRHSKVRSTRA